MHTFHQLSLSVGEIAEVLHRVAAKAKPLLGRLQEQLRASRVVHADETGWRQDGVNGYLWSFSSDKLRYFLQRQSRGSEVVREALGEGFSGVLVSDFYSAYSFLEGPHQRCWVHLCRDVHELSERHPLDPSVREWARAVHETYLAAKAYVQGELRRPEK